jgi:hypothetical protein
MFPSFFEELTKLAKEESLKTKAMQGAVGARPWIKRGLTGAIPTAVAANLMLPMKDSPLKRKLVAGAGILGGVGAMGDLALKRWAKRNPRRKLSRELAAQGQPLGKSASVMRKVAAMAGDLRMKGLGNVKRPPFPTEDSKRFGFQQLQNSKAPGNFTTQTQPKHLRRPGPSISQVAPKLGG